MSEMIERVARAHAQWYVDKQIVLYPGCVDRTWPLYVDLARATIAALREPIPVVMDEAPMRAGLIKGYGSFTAAEVWRAMIDAALGGK